METKDVLANLCCFALYLLISWCGLNLHYEMLGGYYPEVRVLYFVVNFKGRGNPKSFKRKFTVRDSYF